MRTIIIVQARMTSTRLPGKVLKQVLGKSLLEHQLERLRRVRQAAGIVVATTTNATDNPIVDLCECLAVPSFRGPEDDVLTRFLGAAKMANAEAVVRITADCPLIDPAVVDEVISVFLARDGGYDYVSNVFPRTYPRGLDTEVFSRRVLDEIAHTAVSHHDREHVTPGIYNNPQRYRIGNVRYKEDQSGHRWTVDTPEDFELIRRMFEALYPVNAAFNMEDCLSLIRQHPEWEEINAGVRQKGT